MAQGLAPNFYRPCCGRGIVISDRSTSRWGRWRDLHRRLVQSDHLSPGRFLPPPRAGDKTHGRIWRVSKRGAAAGSPPALRGAGRAALISSLKSPERWIRLKAKQVLVSQGMQKVPDEMRTWKGRDLFEAMSLLQMLGLEDRAMLEMLSHSEDHRARAYAARVAGDWGEFDLLEVAAQDVHPRVRMEAVLACTKFSHAGAILIAAEVAERPRDRWIDYALAQAVHYLEPIWLPAFQRGELDFGERRRGLASVLAYAGPGRTSSRDSQAVGGRRTGRRGAARSAACLGDGR